MPRHHKSNKAALIISGLLAVTCLAPCEEKVQSAEEQSIARIEKRIEEAYDLWCSEDGAPRETYDAALIIAL